MGCNFCPFASRPITENTVHYQVDWTTELLRCADALIEECRRLDKDPGIETSLLILPNAVPVFNDYLKLLSLTESLLKRYKYESIYQVASFHPLYRFKDTSLDDPANFTNRSIYPMLHILRESSVERALKQYDRPELIPERNIQFARAKGLEYMKMLRDSCL